MNITPATDSDRGPIVDTWLKSYRCAHAAGLISMDRWADVMRVELNELLDRSQVLVARGTTEGTFYGWAAFSHPHQLHYVYVFEPYRKRRVGRELVRAADLDRRFTYSCRTCDGERLLRKMGLRSVAKFNPLHARFKKDKRAQKEPVIEYRRTCA